MDEYIERKSAIKAIYESDHFSVRECFGWRAREIEEVLRAVPAADVVPVRNGRWIEDHDYLKCPECSVMVKRDFTFFDIGDWNYCPNCGERMDGSE